MAGKNLLKFSVALLVTKVIEVEHENQEELDEHLRTIVATLERGGFDVTIADVDEVEEPEELELE